MSFPLGRLLRGLFLRVTSLDPGNVLTRGVISPGEPMGAPLSSLLTCLRPWSQDGHVSTRGAPRTRNLQALGGKLRGPQHRGIYGVQMEGAFMGCRWGGNPVGAAKVPGQLEPITALQSWDRGSLSQGL